MADIESDKIPNWSARIFAFAILVIGAGIVALVWTDAGCIAIAVGLGMAAWALAGAEKVVRKSGES
jgi:hypothetical protein